MTDSQLNILHNSMVWLNLKKRIVNLDNVNIINLHLDQHNPTIVFSFQGGELVAFDDPEDIATIRQIWEGATT